MDSATSKDNTITTATVNAMSTNLTLANILYGRKSPPTGNVSDGPCCKKRRTNETVALSIIPSASLGDSSSSQDQQSEQPKNERLDLTIQKKQQQTKTNPIDYIVQAFQDNGCDATIRFSSQSDQFHTPTDEEIAAYDHDVVREVRTQNIGALRERLQSGRCLQCCNRFGEGLTHMACRRGYLDVVRFMILEAGCTLFVRDDYGRTPMHDACWSPKPNFKLMLFLIEQAPELLLMSDVRGNTPYAYVRKEHWGEWVLFLEEHKLMLRTKESKKKAAEDEQLAIRIVG